LATQLRVPILNSYNDDRLNLNCNNNGNNDNGCVPRMALSLGQLLMKTCHNLYDKIISFKNIFLAYRKARKGKTKKPDIVEFEKDLWKNLLSLQNELANYSYTPKPLKTFILRDPKTRKISKADFRDRIVHHAIILVIEPIFDKTFIYDSCANRKGKGNLFAIKRFQVFIRKVSRNGNLKGWFNNNQIKGYCFKADIKHYFQEVDHEILINILMRKVKDRAVLGLIEKILDNASSKLGGRATSRDKDILPTTSGLRGEAKKGMPLGNLTSQFFANVYLNELDYFIKHELKAKYYIRYVDDFIILHESKEQLQVWIIQIEEFLRNHLKIELHPQKSKIISLSRGVDFVGFRNFYHFQLLRKRNIKKIIFKIKQYKLGNPSYKELMESFQGWDAYAKWANSYNVIKRFSFLESE